jgi:hypothetical protein
MAEFKTKLHIRLIGKNRWSLDEPLVYATDVKPRVFTVPKDFVTDFASVPRLPLVYLLTGNTAHAPAVVHDYLYRFSAEPRSVADKIFLEAMRVSGVPLWRRNAMYLAVRAFGGKHYKTPPK